MDEFTKITLEEIERSLYMMQSHIKYNIRHSIEPQKYLKHNSIDMNIKINNDLNFSNINFLSHYLETECRALRDKLNEIHF